MKTTQEQKIEVVSALMGDDFIVKPRRAIGSTDSVHGVVFGEHRVFGDAVAKPFHSKGAETKARNEMRQTKMVGSLGYLTLKPLIVVADRDLHIAAFLSEYQPGLLSLNGYSVEAEPDSEDGKVIAPSVTRISTILSELHSERITHGDPQIKNFGFLKDTNEEEPIIFDFETTTRHGGQGCDADMPVRLKRDLSRLGTSLGRRQFGGVQPDVAMGHFQETVLDPYSEGLAGGARLMLRETVHSATDAFMSARSRQQIRNS